MNGVKNVAKNISRANAVVLGIFGKGSKAGGLFYKGRPICIFLLERTHCKAKHFIEMETIMSLAFIRCRIKSRFSDFSYAF